MSTTSAGRTIVIPNPEAIKADLEDTVARRLSNPERIATLHDAVDRISTIAREGHGYSSAPRETRLDLFQAYETLRDVLNGTPVGGRARWPEEFWHSPIGLLVFYAFWEVEGDRLLQQREVAGRLGCSVPRVAQLQATGDLDYLDDVALGAANQGRRRTPEAMLDDFIARSKKEVPHVTPEH